MSKPIVAIIGRPNVGKSTLFNRIVGKRRAVVEDLPGITRDRLYEEVAWNDKAFLIVDTGGFQTESDEDIIRQVKKQALVAVEEADIIILLMDAESGLMPSDIELTELLRKYNKKVFYVVNKIDGPKKETKLLYDFCQLGVDLLPISALKGYGFDVLKESIFDLLPEGKGEASEFPKISIVGRPNVGKSTLVNSLLGSERMIVSSVPGTTRDAVDSICSYYKRKYIIVDTAGIRKKGQMAKSVEQYSFLGTVRNIQDCDVALIVLNAEEGVVEMDQRIAGYVYEAGKGAIILFNKWDTVDKDEVSINDMEEKIYRKLWFMRYAPILTISAISKQRVTKVFSMIDKVIAESSKRITTHELNLFLKDALNVKSPPLVKGRRVKIYYITQARTDPPGFVLFTNNKEGISSQYIAFLENKLRERFSFEGVPVRFFVRQRESEGKRKR
ncbi:MAG: ribosome biogenesis GTPase Der [Nitrospirae bacterium]|nr:ribosome biogenesis GTPase Der [Nitrospirota bacterium]